MLQQNPDGFSDALFPNIGYTYLINLGTPFIMQIGEKKFNMKTDGFLPRNKSIECYHRQGSKLFGIKFKISPIIFKTRVNFGEYREYIYPLSYLMRIAHNLCEDHFRKIKSKPVISTSEGADIFDVLAFAEPGAEDKIMKMQSSDRIMKLVCRLPEYQREIIMLRHFADLKFREISTILGCSVNTTLGRMRYALLNLPKLIEEKQIAL